ncbi:MAG TPA: prepilin-type N-terminal cleavage/methylation domain-containing protein [Gemmatimonadaceae bacterium]|nr:prepilin-type N-terminal cleavage/methylation domain-containing protein [Gemmatimonadaceae bacterium]
MARGNAVIQPFHRNHSHGFTLPEVLVSVAMISILAAAVVPTVVGQLQKGDTNRLGGDLMAIRGAIEQFVSDVERYPSNVGELTAPITTAMTTLGAQTPASVFSGPDVQHWRGPYLNKDSIAVRITAYGDSILGKFFVDTLGTSDNTHTTGGTRYLIILVPGVDSLTAVALDNLYDDGNTLTGFIRWRKNPGGGRDTLKVLATPLQ